MSFLADTNDFVERITSILNSKGMNIDIYYFLSNHIPKEYYDKQRNHPILLYGCGSKGNEILILSSILLS